MVALYFESGFAGDVHPALGILVCVIPIVHGKVTGLLYSSSNFSVTPTLLLLTVP